MAQYEITSPNGERFRITAPDDATNDQVMEFARYQFEQMQESKKAKIQSQIEADKKLYSPINGMSGTEKFLAGAGKGFNDLYLGAKDLIQDGANFAGFDVGNSAEQETADARNRDAELMNTGAGFAGNVVGNIAATLPAGLAGNTYKAATLAGGALGALQPTINDESRTANTAIGSALGAFGKWGGDKLSSAIVGKKPNLIDEQNMKAAADSLAKAQAKFGGAGSETTASGAVNFTSKSPGYEFGFVSSDAVDGATDHMKQLADIGEALGFRMTPGQKTWNKPLMQMEAKLESQPMTSSPFFAVKDQNQKQLNRIAASAIGEKADELSPEVLGRAKKRISDVYNMVADDNVRAIDPDDILSRLGFIEEEFQPLLKTPVANHPLVAQLLSTAAKGGATGKQLQSMSKNLNKTANKELTSQMGDRDLGIALHRVKDVVDDYLQQGLDPLKSASFDNARKQYRTLMQLTKNPNVIQLGRGDINARSLVSSLARTDKNGFVFGKNNSPLYEAARFSHAYSPLIGDSGTATRSMVMGPVDTALSIPFNLATKAYVSPITVSAASKANAAASGLARPIKGLLDDGLFGGTEDELMRKIARYGSQSAGAIPLGLLMADQ